MLSGVQVSRRGNNDEPFQRLSGGCLLEHFPWSSPAFCFSGWLLGLQAVLSGSAVYFVCMLTFFERLAPAVSQCSVCSSPRGVEGNESHWLLDASD